MKLYNVVSEEPLVITKESLPFEFFTVYTMLAEMAVLTSKDLTTAKFTSSGAQPGARENYCSELNWYVLVRGSLN